MSQSNTSAVTTVDLISSTSNASIQGKKLKTHTLEVETLPSPLDLLLLTITKVEFNAVFQLLESPQGQPKILRGLIQNTVYYVGRYGRYTAVLLAAFGAGMGNAMNYLHEALQLFKCQLVINVGIAWSANPDKYKLGDVLVAKRVVNIDDVKRHQGKIIERSAGPQIEPRINAVMNTTEQFWEDEKYKVHIGLYVGSNTLLNDAEVRKTILARYPEAIGGEMECFAVYEAANFGGVSWMIVKGVSDFGDGDKHDEYQPVAVGNAALFAHLMCENFKTLILRSTRQEVEEKKT